MKLTLRRLLLTSLLITLAAISAVYGLWHQGTIQSWILSRAENAVVQIYDRKFRGHLPFEVEKVEYERNWAELVIGRLGKVSITLKKDDLRIHLDGPLRFPAIRWTTFKQLYRKFRDLPVDHADEKIELDYSPVVRFEDQHPGRPPGHLPDAFAAHLQVNLSGQVDELEEIYLTLNALPGHAAWRWSEHGIELQKPELNLNWKQATQPQTSPLQAWLQAESFSSHDNIRVVRPEISAQVPLSLKPFEMGSLLQLEWKARSGEALFGDRYFSAEEEPLHGRAEITQKNAQWTDLELTIGSREGHQLHLALSRRDKTGKADEVAQARLRLDPLSFKETLPALLKSTANAGAPFNSLAVLQEIDFKDGKLALSAEGILPLHPKDFSRTIAEAKLEKARLQIEDASFLWPAHQLAINNLNLNLPYAARTGVDGVKGIEGELSIHRLGYRKLRGKLLPTRISLQENGNRSTFRIGEKGSRIPLDLDGLLLRIDSIGGTAKLFPLQYNLETKASLEPTASEQVLGPLCLFKPGNRIPPAKIQVRLPKIEVSPAVTDLTGFVRADLFGGSIQLDEMGIFDFLSPVPEFDFNLTMDGIDLHSLGEWVNFGEMDGTLSAYAHDVVFQSWLPTQYDFEVKVKSLHHSDVVFSPTAMKNFGRLFTPEGIDHIPGYAQWLAFGWPSRILGGYDIDYAGVHVHSEDGYIRLETLDPATDADPYSAHQKHFILYGRRFKIPLKSSRYPLILDAPAMGNYVHQMFGVIQGLAKKKKGETENEDENLEEDSLPAECVPSDLSHI